ncbi:Ribosomal RNA small subunit methyltransferase B [Salisediminibacterium beveridgei]|uniref:16S rRNA (cytosine(967)-C(5))-methyltransferase n=2 Tax=Salisediminibacterium beveridgei TaxID=632773 RepID=A0A1D7QW88_9BACI|nr:Ribosomal RNA small subunit methyltransferase B [Salisediminibacterium beveridgei]
MNNQIRTGNVRNAALDVLIKIAKQQAYSHLLIDETVKKKELSEKDIPLLTEMVYGTLQYQRKLDFYIGGYSKKPLDKLENWVLILLRLSVYQMVYLDRVPDHAVLNEAVMIAGKRGHKGISGMVNGILRAIQREGLPDTSGISPEFRKIAIETSHPDWMIKRWIEQYGEEIARRIAEGNLSYPITSARVNTLLTVREELIKEWVDSGMNCEAGPWLDESIRVTKGVISKTQAFKEGRCSIQDEGSMLVTQLLNPQPRERVLDACAAPGGKSSHIAERMDNQGELISLDIHEHKVKLIQSQAERLGISMIQPVLQDARTVSTAFEEASFDRILLDVPCSGLGVIQRKPDLKWSKSEQDIERLTVIQRDILDHVWPLLKSGGIMVYSTCTVDREENENQVKDFLKKHPDAIIEPGFEKRLPEEIRTSPMANETGIQLIPAQYGTDGFYMTAILKQ